MKQGDERWWEISRGRAQLTPAEISEGWHFCFEFDEDLTQGEVWETEARCNWCGYKGSGQDSTR